MNSSDADVGRKQRFDRLVGVWHRDMYRYAVWLCRDPAIAEDVVQEALLRAWKPCRPARTSGKSGPLGRAQIRRPDAAMLHCGGPALAGWMETVLGLFFSYHCRNRR